LYGSTPKLNWSSTTALLLSLLSFVALSVLLALPARAGLFDVPAASAGNPLPVEQAYQLRQEQVGPGRIDLVWEMPPDYYLYRDKISVQPGPGVSLVDQRRGESELKQDPLFGAVQVYHNEARVQLLIGRSGAASSGTLEVSYQGCWEGGICYPPQTQQLELFDLVPAAPLAWPQTASTAQAEPPSADGVAVPAAALSEQDRFARLLAGSSALVVLAAFFVAGLALSLTPCVFPMIPILSGIIVGHGRRMTTARAFLLSLVYVLAMALTYALAGVVVGLFGANVQVALQNPWVISLFAGLFVVLALSMFGFYELQVPSWIQSRVSSVSQQQKGGSLWGVAVMGILSALIVGPCMAAPLAGALIYIGQSGDPLLGGLALFVLSLGMGVPLLLVGASAGRLLPHAGAWMEGVKAAFGVLLLLMAVWMLDRIVPTTVTMGLVGVILIVSAVYLNALDRLAESSSGWQRLWKGLGLILLVYGVALLIGLLGGGRSLIYPLQGVIGGASGAAQAQSQSRLPFEVVRTRAELEPLLAAAAAAGQPVMLDFYADWCVSCVELEYTTFADAGVESRLSSFRLIKVDVTSNDAEVKALNQRYQVFGPPALFFYDRSGQLQPTMTMVGVVEPQEFLRLIQPL